MKTDTIAAIATGLTNAGISKVRISGDEALQVIDKIYRSKNGKKVLSKENSHTIHYGFIYDQDEIVDEVMVILMKAPSTYTREDIVEIDCHGGIVVTKRILETVLKNGARLAEPGEFTKRAFLNGRIDLSRAEAVCDVINAKSEMALKSAVNQLRGKEFEQIEALRIRILRDIAFIEAALDDPEHISLDGFNEEVQSHINEEKKMIEKMIRDSKNGRFIKEGIRTVILGKPNAGKSSLLNNMMGEDRAIVTDIAGTTRDTLEETIQFGGITLNIIDTAGIRSTEDVVERIGVEKAKKIAEEGDLILFVVDSSVPMDDNDEMILRMIQDKKSIIIYNKTDLQPYFTMSDIKQKNNSPIIAISLTDEIGLDLLEEKIKEMFFQGEIVMNDELYITNERHREALTEALRSLNNVENSLSLGMTEDFLSIDLMSAYEELGKIIGENVEDDLVNMIFKEFCMGK